VRLTRTEEEHAEISAAADAMTNRSLRVPERNAFIALARIVRWHLDAGQADPEGYVRVYLAELAAHAGISPTQASRYIWRAGEFNLFAVEKRTYRDTEIHPTTGQPQSVPRAALYVRPVGASFLAQVRLIARCTPARSDEGWGGNRRPCEYCGSHDHRAPSADRCPTTSRAQRSSRVSSCRSKNVPGEGSKRRRRDADSPDQESSKVGPDRPTVRGHLSENGEQALAYARKGWHVFPVHHMTPEGCSCGHRDYSRPGKHPRTRRGHASATTTTPRIRRWWGAHPEDNIGVATEDSGLLVIDIDPRHNGDVTWDEVVSHLGREIEETLTVVTGGGGRHLYYVVPESLRVPSRANALGPGVDVRAAGGYVIAPPSSHASDGTYRFTSLFHDDPIDAPLALLDLLTSPSRDAVEDNHRTRQTPVAGQVAAAVFEGERNDRLFRRACGMRGRGATDGQILEELRWLNRQYCHPPLTDAEVRTIAASAARYPTNAEKAGTPSRDARATGR
jgi:hypothetical protein